MRVLVVKMSSLGDVIHTLPAVSDAVAALPDLEIDWVVEEAFADVPGWHPAVRRVIPVALRRWRRKGPRALLGGEWGAFRRDLRSEQYDLVIDAQGLLKSAVVARMARGPVVGLDRDSARERAACLFYQRRLAVPKGQHAITRVRKLFAAALDYRLPARPPDYGLARHRFALEPLAAQAGYVVFLHGTTWSTKHWPEAYWTELARQAAGAGLQVQLPQGSAEERERAERIAATVAGATVLPDLSLTQIAAHIAGARAVVAVDTGLAHLAAALDVPGITLYGATEPGLTGTEGRNQRHLQADFPCAPCLSRHCHHGAEGEIWPGCYSTLKPGQVWSVLSGLVGVQ
jgi:heptosyltransferase-1